MFDEPNAAKRFASAPPSVSAATSAVLEPVIAVGMLLVMHAVYAQAFDGASMALLLLTLVMLFPGINRIGITGAQLAIDVFSAWLQVVLVLLVIGYATRPYHEFSRDMLTAWAVATPFAQWLASILMNHVQRQRMRLPQSQRASVIVGAGPMCGRVAWVLQQRQGNGWNLLGVFDDRDPTKPPPPDKPAAERVAIPEGVPFLGSVKGLPQFIEEHGVKDVFVTLPLITQPRILNMLETLQNTTASVHYVPDVFGISIIQGRLEDMAGLPVVSLMLTPFTGVNSLLKRISDIVLSLLILALITPLMIGVAIGVKLSSPGPVIFRQRRTGLDGEIIEVYKFRSMTTMDDGPVVRQATRDDDRVTPFGRFIRRKSLDELPQFINVLQGRMSIVGPRPHAVAHNDEYRNLVKAYMARHKVKPGITGWAQVNGYRGETDTIEKMERRIEYDLEYLRNWSLQLDLLIILRTAKQVVLGRDAY